MRLFGRIVVVLLMCLSVSSGAAAVDDLGAVLNSARAALDEKFFALGQKASGLAGQLSSGDMSDERIRGILSSMCALDVNIIDCAFVDVNGVMRLIEPSVFRNHEGESISKQPQVAALHKDKRPVMSDVFFSVEKIYAFDIEYPVISPDGSLRGSLSMLINAPGFMSSALGKIVGSGPYKIWMMQQDGLIIYDPDPDQINRNVFTDPLFKGFDSLLEFSRTALAQPEGVGGYEFYVRGESDKKIVKKAASWGTFSFLGADWRIIVMLADDKAV